MRYKDSIVIYRASQTSDGQGGYTDSTTATLYAGPCDAQEVGATFFGSLTGHQYEGECVVFMPCSLDDLSLQNGDAVTITFESTSTRSGSIARTIRLDDSLDVNYD